LNYSDKSDRLYSKRSKNATGGGHENRTGRKTVENDPENDREKKELNQLWNVIIDCVKDNKKLVPVGQYTPGIKEVATFHIE